MRLRRILACCGSLLLTSLFSIAPRLHPAAAESATGWRPAPGWVARSDQNARLVLEALARLDPEVYSNWGVAGLDEQITDLSPGYEERARRANKAVLRALRPRLAAERDPRVRQDLQVLIHRVTLNLRGIDLSRRHLIPYFELPDSIFTGLRNLLDDQVPPERRKAALVRLRKYTGMEPGCAPSVQLAEARTRERLNEPGLVGPSQVELERSMANTPFFVDGIGKLFQKYHLDGYEQPYSRLKEQMTAYDEFLKQEVMPKARRDFRLPPEVYALRLEQFGIDIPPAQLVPMARAAFREIQGEMQGLAPKVSRLHGWRYTDYRDVIKALKKEQLTDEAILPHYRQRLAQIEAIIRREKLVSLPQRPVRIRIATPAESADTPNPYFHAPRLLGNTGEQGEFVLPVSIPAPPGSGPAMQKMDDFTCEAASWPLTAHEARPGHELQYSTMLERGVSVARAIFGRNVTASEGWGLYAESIIKPYMPLEGQMMALQGRLLRAQRAFSDPELQRGKVTREQVRQLLKRDVVTSEALANSEIDRYTSGEGAGQAPSYFYGYTKLVQLREEVKRRLGSRFSLQQFHDTVLAQGALPLSLVRQGVLADLGRSR